MHRIALVLTLASCWSSPAQQRSTGASSARTKPPTASEVAALLAPPIDRRAARIVVQGPGQLVVGAGVAADPGAPLDECTNLEVPVIDEREGWLRIVEQQRDVVLALWVPDHYLGDVIAVRTPLLANAAPTNTWLMPGAPVRVVERDATRARVELRQLNDRAQGWVDAAALGRTYTRTATPPAPAPSARVHTVQPLLDAPSASATSMVSTAFGGPYERIGDRHGYTELRYRSEWLDARGFVETSGIQARGPTGMCEGMRTRFLVGAVLDSHADAVHEGPLAVPSGTCLRARPDGPLVGVQRLAGVRDVIVERSGGWAQAAVAMTLGTHAVWMRVERRDGQLAIVPGC